MKVSTELTDTVGTLIDLKRENILRVNHEYQRGLSWTGLQKLMFIDSIFRGYSIPAFYFHIIQPSAGGITNTFYDIVDGQQRIDSIYDYFEGAFSLLDPSADTDFRFPNFVKNIKCPWAGKRFDELEENLKDEIKNTKVVVYKISSTDENEIRDLFIRLQGGTPLTPQDKRDSWPGNFTEFVLKNGGKSGVAKWYGIPVFKENAKVPNESKRRQLIPYAEGGTTHTSNAALMHKDCHPKVKGEVEKFREYWDERGDDIPEKKRTRKNKKRQIPANGTKVKFEYGGLRYSGVIENRTMVLNGNHEGRYKSFSEASRAISRTNRNGWKDWYIQLPGQTDWMLADNWRDI